MTSVSAIFLQAVVVSEAVEPFKVQSCSAWISPPGHPLPLLLVFGHRQNVQVMRSHTGVWDRFFSGSLQKWITDPKSDGKGHRFFTALDSVHCASSCTKHFIII